MERAPMFLLRNVRNTWAQSYIEIAPSTAAAGKNSRNSVQVVAGVGVRGGVFTCPVRRALPCMSRERGQTCWHYRGVSENLVVFVVYIYYVCASHLWRGALDGSKESLKHRVQSK